MEWHACDQAVIVKRMKYAFGKTHGVADIEIF
jgi:hypothetical protein